MSTAITPIDALRKLRVHPGGRGTTVKVTDGLMLSLDESPRGAAKPYQISVLFGCRRTSIELDEGEVVSRSKGNWRRDKTWRLSDVSITRFCPQITALVDTIRRAASDDKKRVI